KRQIVPDGGAFGVDAVALGALSVRRFTVEDLVSKQNLLACSARRDRKHVRVRPSLSCVRHLRNRQDDNERARSKDRDTGHRGLLSEPDATRNRAVGLAGRFVYADQTWQQRRPGRLRISVARDK